MRGLLSFVTIRPRQTMGLKNCSFASVGVILFLILARCPSAHSQAVAHPKSQSGRATTLSANGFQVTQHQKDTTIVTLLSADGAASTQYAVDGTPLRGAILRYRDARAFGLDYSDHTAHSVTLRTAVTNKLAENARLGRVTAVPGMSGAVRGTLNPPPLLSRSALSAMIGGLRVEAIVANVGGKNVRIWHSAALPRTPPVLGGLLARLVVDCTPKHTNHDDEGDTEREGREKDRKRSRPCDAERLSLAQTLASTFALRTEIQINGSWMTAVDTTEVRRVRVPKSTFDPPRDLHVVPTLAATGVETGTTSPGFDSPAGGQAPISATVRTGPGPVLEHVDVYQFYWGRMFSLPGNAGAVNELTNAYQFFFHSGYTGFLSRYGIGPGGGLMHEYFINDDPERAVGTKLLGFVIIAAHVVQWSFQTSAPSFWWVFGGHDPLYMIYVPTELVAADGWDGFHLAAPSLANLLLPVFLWPFVHDFLPYGIAKISQSAMSLPAHGLLFRRTCASTPTSSPGPPDCVAILQALPSIDAGTEALSHELVEAITDPYPFFGWSDAARQPAAENSEIADICEKRPFPFATHTIVGLGGAACCTAVDTYWSNADNACVPESRPKLALISPSNGETIGWLSPRGPWISMLASATDPFDGTLNAISWTLDGTPLSVTGSGVQSPFLTVGAHSVTASATDSQGLSVSASASFTVVASPPTGTIISPTAGASVVARSFVLHGDATDPQDSPVADSGFAWTINGKPVGTTRIVVASATTLGPATITLTVTNSAGLQWTGTRSVLIVNSTGVPSVTITSPANPSGFRVPPNTNIPPTEHFSAIATEADGSPIPDARIVWTDSVDGGPTTALRSGAAAFDRALSGNSSSVTTHRVTCTVTGASGATAADITTVYVGQIP